MKDYMIFGRDKGDFWFVFISFWFISFYPQNSIAQFDAKIAELQEIDRANLELLHSVSFPVSLNQPHNLYIYSEWISGWLSLKGNGELIPLMTRFNILTGGVEIKSRKQIRMLQANRVDMVLMGPRFFVSDESSPTNYFEVLSHGQLNLLESYQLITTYEGSNNLTSNINGEKKQTATAVYYYKKEGEVAQPLKIRRKIILELMENNEDVKQFIETEKLKLSKKEHLVKLFDFYNGI
ncbi:MAG: hypothetical protein AAFN93_11910 [Bacteroidota bacterium]